MVVAAACPLAPSSPLVSAYAWLFPCSLVVLKYLESLFAVVQDAFASLEHLRVSSSSAVTQGSISLSPLKS